MKTEWDIKVLQYQWLNDPTWDIEYTEGFEEHKEELRKWRVEVEEKKKALLKKQQRAEKLQCSIPLVEYIEKMEGKIEMLESNLLKLENKIIKLENLNKQK